MHTGRWTCAPGRTPRLGRGVNGIGLAIVAGALSLAVQGCQKPEPPPLVERDVAPPRGSAPWRVDNARSAAPPAVSARARIVDRPSVTGHYEPLVAQGNGWTCMPDDLSTPSNDPVCADSIGWIWQQALQAHAQPRLSVVAMFYKLQGGNIASDTDPSKQAPDPGQQWGVDPPFIGLILPNPQKAYAGLPTTRQTDRPWVRYAGTPWAYMVIPGPRK